MEPIKTIDYKGHTIELHYDDTPESPRTWDNLGTIYSNHRDYDFDKHSIEELIREVGGDEYDNVIPWDLIGKKYYYQKVWIYDHSGVCLKCGENNPWGSGWTAWDSGLGGIIVCSKEKAKKEYGYKKGSPKLRERVEKYLRGEIEDLDKWVSGEIYGFRTFDKDGNEIDSCWGFYEEDEAINDAKSIIDYEDERVNGKSLFPEED